MRKWALGCLFFLVMPLEAKILGEYVRVNPYGLPGDSETNHLSLPGLRFHEANDWYGNTDKLISGVGGLSLLRVWPHFSTSLGVKGRFIQPILKTRNDQPKLQENIGVYAESMETFWNNSLTIYGKESLGLKLDFGVGYTDVGSHGLVNLYQRIHEAVGSPVQDDEFGSRLKDNFYSTSWGAFLIFPVLDQFNMMIGHSGYDSPAFHETAIEYSFVVSLSRSFALSLKYMYVFQDRSEWWDQLPNRQQYIGGLRLFGFWTPSFMYVTPYVRGDKFGQVYVSPISFTWNF